LDCDGCYSDFLQAEVVFVDYVRDRKEADVHVLITSIETGAGGREYTAAFTGLGALQGVDHTLRAVTTTSDTEDVIRRQLATTLRIGLLNYVEGEESQRELEFSGSASADRITPDWKITIGAFFEQRREEFDLDEDEPVSV